MTKDAAVSSEILHVIPSPDYTNNLSALSGYDQIMDLVWNGRS